MQRCQLQPSINNLVVRRAEDNTHNKQCNVTSVPLFSLYVKSDIRCVSIFLVKSFCCLFAGAFLPNAPLVFLAFD